MAEQIFGLVEQAGEQARLQPGDDADPDAGEQAPPRQIEMTGKREQRAGSDQ